MSTMMSLRLPAGVTAKRVAGGRRGATRWELYRGTDQTQESWLGDIVRWQPEGTWDWQPRAGDVVECKSAEAAVAAVTL